MPRTTATGTELAFPMTSSAADATSSATHTSVATQVASHGVGGAPQVDDGRQAGAADGDVDDALAPGPAEGVGHHHRHLAARGGPQPVADAPGRAVGVLGEQGRPAVLDVGEVDTGVGTDEAVAGLGDHEVAAAAQDADRLRLDDPHAGRRGRRGRCGTRRPSALDTIFWVTTTTSPSTSATRSAMSVARSSPGRISPSPVTGTHGQRGPGAVTGLGGHAAPVSAPEGRPRSRGGRDARAAAWSGVCMTVGATTQRTPQASTASAEAASASSITRVPTKSA